MTVNATLTYIARCPACQAIHGAAALPPGAGAAWRREVLNAIGQQWLIDGYELDVVSGETVRIGWGHAAGCTGPAPPPAPDDGQLALIDTAR